MGPSVRLHQGSFSSGDAALGTERSCHRNALSQILNWPRNQFTFSK